MNIEWKVLVDSRKSDDNAMQGEEETASFCGNS